MIDLQNMTNEQRAAVAVALEQCDGCLRDWADYYDSTGNHEMAHNLRQAQIIIFGR